MKEHEHPYWNKNKVQSVMQDSKEEPPAAKHVYTSAHTGDDTSYYHLSDKKLSNNKLKKLDKKIGHQIDAYMSN